MHAPGAPVAPTLTQVAPTCATNTGAITLVANGQVHHIVLITVLTVLILNMVTQVYSLWK